MAILRKLLHRLRGWQPCKSLTDPLILGNLGVISFGFISMLLASVRAGIIPVYLMVAMWHASIHFQTPQICVDNDSTLLPMHAQLLEAYACKPSLWADSCRVHYYALLERHSHEIWSETNICNWGAGTPQKVFANRS